MLDITRGGREIQAWPGSMLAADYIGHVADDHHVPGAEMSHRIASNIQAGVSRFIRCFSGEIVGDACPGNVDGPLRTD